MRATRTLAASLAAVALLTTAAAAQAAPVPGARYETVGGKPAVRQFATVSADGKRIARYRVAGTGSCNNGKSDESFINNIGETRTTIKPDGSFSHSTKPFKGPKKSGGKLYVGTGTIGFTGSASPDGNRLIVKVTGTFKAKGLTCRQASTVTLFRRGTPGAPAASPRLANGRYPGTKAGRVRVSAFSMDAFGGEFSRLRITARLHCTRGKDFTNAYTIFPQLLTVRDTYAFGNLLTGKVRGGGGQRYQDQDLLTLAFFRRGSTFGYRGTYQDRVVYTRKGKVTDRCTLPKTRFSATLPPA